MKSSKICTIILVLMMMAPVSALADIISIGAQVGWSIPKGGVFESFGGEKSAKGGVHVDADVLYHLSFVPLVGDRLAAGVTYNGSLLFGANINNADIGLYGLSLFGAKAYFKGLPGPISPYVALSAGVTRLSTPEITMGDVVISEKQKVSSFGLRPEIGVKLSKFTVSAGYIVPVNYHLEGGNSTAGVFQISIGMRFGFL